MKYMLIIVSLLIFSGCIVEKKPSITDFKIAVEHKQATVTASGCKDKTLKISQAFSSSTLQSLKMSYVKSDSKVYAYSEAQWMESPKYAISKAVFLKIRDANIFSNVNISKSRSNGDLLLEILIEDFMQYYNNDLDKSYANISISLNIIDSKDYTVVASKNFNSKVDTKTLNAEGGVDALNSALSNILDDNIEWLNGVCK